MQLGNDGEITGLIILKKCENMTGTGTARKPYQINHPSKILDIFE